MAAITMASAATRWNPLRNMSSELCSFFPVMLSMPWRRFLCEKKIRIARTSCPTYIKYKWNQKRKTRALQNELFTLFPCCRLVFISCVQACFVIVGPPELVPPVSHSIRSNWSNQHVFVILTEFLARGVLMLVMLKQRAKQIS